MKKKRIIFSISIVLLVVAAVLVQYLQFKPTAAHKPATVASSAASSSSAAKKSVKPLQGNVTDKDLENKKTYEVPQTDEETDKYVESGPAEKVGEYTISPQGNKAELGQTTENKQTLTNGAFTYEVTQIKVFHNDPRTDEAIQMAQTALNSRDINGPYTTLSIQYKLKNNGAKAAVTDGVESATFSTGDVRSPINGLDNDATLATKVLAANSTTSSFVTILVPSSIAKTVKTVDISFAGLLDQNHSNQLAKPSQKLQLTF
ncbi:MAG: hypothetical protein LBT80_00630 [Lactobacillaceae bacterium]|jgi:hypothetical protein|nr:hypothetical protein [Lactobacillaceae bacterium]